jgi:hypothetical protein
MFSELNSLYWIVASQSRFLPYDWIGKPEEQRIYDRYVVPVAAFEGKGMVLLRPGVFSELDGHLVLDEWTNFLGFPASESEAVGRAERLGLSQMFSCQFYELLAREGDLFAIYVDGWWEFCPATDEVFERVRDCGPFREIAPRSPK